MKQVVSQLFYIFTLASLALAVPLPKSSRVKRSSTVSEFTLKDRQPLDNRDELLHKQIEEKDYPGDYDHDCKNLISNPEAPVYQRSSCPWYYENNRNPARYPINIPMAKRKCNTTTTCIGSTNPDEECVAINQAMTVLIQDGTDTEGNLIYREQEFYAVVGYTCASKRIATSKPTSGNQSKSDNSDTGSEPDNFFEK